MSVSGDLDFILLYVPDLERAKAFYNGKLGFGIEDEAPGFVQFKRGTTGAIFALQEKSGATPYGGVELWWRVDNADTVHSQLFERGVEIASPPTDMPFGRALSIKDPANNTINMFQLPAGRQ